MGLVPLPSLARRLGRTGKGWLLAGLAGSCILLAATITAAVENEHKLDEEILVSLRVPGLPSDPIGSPRTEEFVRDLSGLGGQGVLFLGVLMAGGFLMLRRQYHAAFLLLAAAAGAYLVAAALKGVFDRPRPSLVSALSFHTGSRSFPSGHSVMAASVYLTLGALVSRLVKPLGHKLYFLGVAALLTFLVGASRVYLGMHHPTDVVAGWILGGYWAIFCWEVTAFLQRRGKVEGPE